MDVFLTAIIKDSPKDLCQVAQLIRMLSQHAKVVGLIPGQGTYKNQPINA